MIEKPDGSEMFSFDNDHLNTPMEMYKKQNPETKELIYKRRIHYDSDGEIRDKYEIKEESNDPLKSVLVSYANGEYDGKKIKEVDEDGNVLLMAKYSKDKIQEEEKYEYYGDGRMKEQEAIIDRLPTEYIHNSTSYYADGTIKKKYIHKKNLRFITNREGELDEVDDEIESEYTFDENGNTLEGERYYNGDLISKDETTYDANGKVLQSWDNMAYEKIKWIYYDKNNERYYEIICNFKYLKDFKPFKDLIKAKVPNSKRTKLEVIYDRGDIKPLTIPDIDNLNV